MRTKIYSVIAFTGTVLGFLLSSTFNAFAQVALDNPLNSQTLCGLIKSILNVILAIGVPVLALFIVWAGFKFVFARGNPAALQVARKNFVYLLFGAFIFFGCWALGQIVANTLNQVSNSTGGTAGPNSALSFTVCN